MATHTYHSITTTCSVVPHTISALPFATKSVIAHSITTINVTRTVLVVHKATFSALTPSVFVRVAGVFARPTVLHIVLQIFTSPVEGTVCQASVAAVRYIVNFSAL